MEESITKQESDKFSKTMNLQIDNSLDNLWEGPEKSDESNVLSCQMQKAACRSRKKDSASVIGGRKSINNADEMRDELESLNMMF